jgi:hypothetical protein
VLTIRKAHLQAFESAMAGAFEREMVAHSQAFSPRLCAVIGEEQLRVVLRRALEHAKGYGFTMRGALRLYIELTFLFGSDFDSDPQYPWAARILTAQGDEMRRAEILYGETLRYQELVSGVEGVNTRSALERLSRMALQPLSYRSGDISDWLMHQLYAVFPQKASYVGERGLIDLIREGRERAATHRLPAGRPEVLIVALMFAFGHRCTDDPLYPWISRTLTNDRLVDSGAAAERLERRAKTWLDHVLAGAEDGLPR